MSGYSWLLVETGEIQLIYSFCSWHILKQRRTTYLFDLFGNFTITLSIKYIQARKCNDYARSRAQVHSDVAELQCPARDGTFQRLKYMIHR